MDELTEVFAEATGETSEKIERGAEETNFIPPEKAPVLNEQL